MILFAAIYVYFLIQMAMASKWKDSLVFEEMKSKLNTVPSLLEKWTKAVKAKISDSSVIVIEKAKTIRKKAWETLKEWKDYVVDKCKNFKTKLNNTKAISSEKELKWEKSAVNDKSVWELVNANKELIYLTKKLIDKYDENLKLLEEINKNLSKME